MSNPAGSTPVCRSVVLQVWACCQNWTFQLVVRLLISAQFDLVAGTAVATRSGTARSTAVGRAAAGRCRSTAAGLAAATCTPLAAKTGQEPNSLVTTAHRCAVIATAAVAAVVAATIVTARGGSGTSATTVVAAAVAASRVAASRGGGTAGRLTAGIRGTAVTRAAAARCRSATTIVTLAVTAKQTGVSDVHAGTDHHRSSQSRPLHLEISSTFRVELVRGVLVGSVVVRRRFDRVQPWDATHTTIGST